MSSTQTETLTAFVSFVKDKDIYQQPPAYAGGLL